MTRGTSGRHESGHASEGVGVNPKSRRSIRSRMCGRYNGTKKGDVMCTGTNAYCPRCGSEHIEVTHEYAITMHFIARLRCSCENAPALAAERSFHKTVVRLRTGLFNELAQVEWQSDEREDEFTEEDDLTIECRTCYSAAEADDWFVEVERVEDSRESATPRRVCAACGSEVGAVLVGAPTDS